MASIAIRPPRQLDRATVTDFIGFGNVSRSPLPTMPRGRAASARALREAGTIMAADQRLNRVKSSLCPQKFLLREMHLTESLGQPFVIELTVDSDDLDINYT